METKTDFDFLVIGGGISGLTFALEAAKHGSVGVLFKRSPSDSSTSWAQGGIATVQDDGDSFELHAEDTLSSGAGLCNKEIVDLVVREGPQRVSELIDHGAKFDLATDGSYDLHQEGGHSRRRILHSADATGLEIQKTLNQAAWSSPNISFMTETSAIDLITTHKLNPKDNKPNRVLGVYALLSSGEVTSLRAKTILMSTGGAGKVYLYTSNPDVASGDGIAMCYRAGVSVANMEFFQFHPTCLFHPKAKSFLITEAMRGEGAKLIRGNGEAFMDRYDPRLELASRDIVARAIDSEMKGNGEDCVFLDISHRTAAFIKGHFPTIYERCLTFGFDITKEPIPVVPAAHYCCGGVVADKNGCTSIQGLYAAGECAHSGLHGGNRLASNSLLEGLVFGYRAAAHASTLLEESIPNIKIPEWDSGAAVDNVERVTINQNWDEIRRFMWNYVGIVRSDKRLSRALSRSEMIEEEIRNYYWDFTLTDDLLELRNLSLVANLVIRSALQRKESRGLHFTTDYPDPSEEFLKDSILSVQA